MIRRNNQKGIKIFVMVNTKITRLLNIQVSDNAGSFWRWFVNS